MIRTSLVAVTLLACAPPERPVPAYDPHSAGLFDAPWPTDDRRDERGLDLSGFPGEDDVTLLGRYLTIAQDLPGWGTSSPIYLPLDSLPDPALLPSPIDSSVPGSSLILVAIDPSSPSYGLRVPVQWELLPRGVLTPRPTLAVAPVFGFPLAPDTRYALIATTDALQPSPAFQERLTASDELADLLAAVQDLGLRPANVAVATAFTTRDPLAELDHMVAATRALPEPQLRRMATPIGVYDRFTTYQVELRAPLWMHGSKPFALSGGGFRYDEHGEPLVAEWETLRLAVSVPRDVEPPPGGFPVALYGHGTGGDFDGFANGNGRGEPAGVLADIGVVGIGFDQPLHGTRGTPNTDEELHSFNYLNPESARAGFRQGALDLIWLARALDRPSPPMIVRSDGPPVHLDPQQMFYVGHSHGGLTGALALPWLSDQLQGAVLSGAGGGLSISIVKRKDPVDIAELLAQVLDLGDDEVLTPLHPVIGLVQLLVEETDPINYAPTWIAEDRGYASRTTHVLLTSGALDEQTDHETAEALAIAGRLPQMSPAWNAPDGFALRGLSPAPSPATHNLTGWDGAPRTGGLSQWEEGDHFVIFRERRATNMWQRFVRTSLEGRPSILP